MKTKKLKSWQKCESCGWKGEDCTCGPEYPALGKDVLAFRKLAEKEGGLKALSIMARKAYGNAVLNAVRKLQAASLRKVFVEKPAHCASGTNFNSGKAILAAVAAQNAAKAKTLGIFNQQAANMKYEAAMALKQALAAQAEFKQAA